MEFEILPETFYSQPKKFSQRDIVLNNQQGIASTDSCTSGFPSHFCFSDLQDGAATSTSEPGGFPSLASASHPMNVSLTTLDARRMRENRVFPQVLVNQPPQASYGKSIRYPAQIIHLTESSVGDERGRQPSQFCASQHHPRRRKLKRKWMQRAGILLGLLLVATCVVYQTCVWTSKWRRLRSYLVLQKAPCLKTDTCNGRSLRNATLHVPINVVNITLCNANPFRGSEIFDLPNGSYLYDTITGIRVGKLRVPSYAKELSKLSIRNLLNISHQLTDMLKSCSINGQPCGDDQFIVVLSSNRLCYRLPLNSTAHEIVLLLDPEEFDYLLPNIATVGFHITVDSDTGREIASIAETEISTRFLDILQPYVESEEIFIGAHFQTYLQIGFSDTPVVQMSSGEHSGANMFDFPAEDAEDATDAVLKPRVFKPVIRSVVQAVNPAFNSRLLYLQQPKNFQRSADAVGRAQLVQKWAYLRLMNDSVAAVIENLALRLGNLKRDFNAMIVAMDALQNSFQSSSPGDYQTPGGFISSCYPKPQSALSTVIAFANTFRQQICQLARTEHLLLQSATSLCTNLQIYGFLQPPNNTSSGYNSLGSKPIYTGATLSAPTEATRTDSFIRLLSKETAANLQLYIIHLLFAESTFHLPITEVLRRQLRTLSAVNMKLLHQTDGDRDRAQSASVDCTSCEKMELGAQTLRGSCRTVKQTLNITHHQPHLEKLGETIATCTQRLEALMKDLTLTRNSNLKHLQSFPQPALPLSLVPPSSLVSLRIKVNPEVGPPITQFVSLEDVASPISELIGILSSGLAVFIAILITWRMLELQRPSIVHALEEPVIPNCPATLEAAAQRYFQPAPLTIQSKT